MTSPNVANPEAASSVAVVTGGTSGIGLAISRLLVERGFRVHAWGRDAAKGAAIAAEVNGATRKTSFVYQQCDVSSAQSIRAAVSALKASGDKVDLLVNAAGVLQRNSLTRPGDMDIGAEIAVLLTGTINVTSHLSELLAKSGSALVVNVGSVAGQHPYPGLSAYGAAKAGIIHFTRAAAQELYRSRIRVICVCPGVVNTKLMPQEELKLIADTLPGRRLQSPDEIGRFIVHLATTSYPSLTGSVIDLDDGAGFHFVPPGAPASTEVAQSRAPATVPAAAGAGGDQSFEKLAAIFSEVFAVPRERIRPELSPNDVTKWDSIGHIRLVGAIEQAFSCTLDVDEVMALTSFGTVLTVISKKK